MPEESICSGLPASSGVATGIAKWVDAGEKEFAHIKENHIIIAPMTNIRFIDAMRRSSGIITSTGGVLCHAGMEAREMNTPCVVAVENVFTKIKDGMEITVDGNTGQIYLGRVDV